MLNAIANLTAKLDLELPMTYAVVLLIYACMCLLFVGA
jgi:hypothetical protein